MLRETLDDGRSAYAVDQVWSGTRVGFGALALGPKVWAAYYDAGRRLTVSEIDPEHFTVCRRTLPVKFAGWDSHNVAVLAAAPDGTLHLAANMHASPLTYARTDATGRFETLALAPMIGRDEAQTTYPTFLKGSEGELHFLYRSGVSGNGVWLVNRWQNGAWSRVGAAFSETSRGGHVSAYPSAFARGPDGALHVAVVWRRTADVRTNFAVSYARTTDFRTWSGVNGWSVAGPLGVDDAERIETPGESTGLLNSPRVVLGAGGQPIVLYTRYGSDGRNVLVAATPSQNGWAVREIAKAAARTELRGGGSLYEVPRFDAAPDASGIRVTVAFSGERTTNLRLDPATLATSPALLAAPPRASSLDTHEREALVAPVTVTVPVPDDARPEVRRGQLVWIAQAPNRDRPRACEPAAPRACNPPPTALRFVPEREGNP